MRKTSWRDRLSRIVRIPPRRAAPEAPQPPIGRFVWAAGGRGGEVGYAVREAVRDMIGPIRPTDADFIAFFADLDIDEVASSWLNKAFADLPDGALVHEIVCIADEATSTRLHRGTPIRARGFYPDLIEGMEGYLFEVLAGPHAGLFVYLGTGGRYGAPLWAAETTLLPGGHPLLDDPARSEAILTAMRAVAIEHGAPGVVVPAHPPHT